MIKTNSLHLPETISRPTKQLSLDLIAKDLQEVEERLHSLFPQELFDGAAHALMFAGGKRIRPAMVLLAAQFGTLTPQVKELAAAVEILHLATLIHDDILDQADTRRNLPSAHIRLGVKGAILLGDYFYGQFLQLISHCDKLALRGLSKVVSDLVRAELHQQKTLYRRISDQEYFTRVGQKAGSYLAECCRLGSLLSGVDANHVTALAAYGYCLGVSFQLHDDWLDFAGNEVTMGKPMSQDMSSGILTLPVLHCLKNSSYSEILASAIATGLQNEADQKLLASEMKKYHSLDYTAKQTQRYSNKAISSLSSLPAGQARDTLKNLACFAIERLN